MATALKEIAARLNVGLIYKTSFDKANRTSTTSPRGLGLAHTLPIFAEIRDTLGLPSLPTCMRPVSAKPWLSV